MTNLGKQNRGRVAVLEIVAWILAAVGCVACSSGGGKSDAGATSGHGGANAGSGGANAGTGGVSAAGSGGDGAGGVAGSGTGQAGTGLAGGMAGIAGGGGAAGASGAAGTGGRPAGTCTFDVQHMPSSAIGTVEIVTWTLDVADLTAARIEFGPSGAAPTMTAPVDLARAAPSHAPGRHEGAKALHVPRRRDRRREDLHERRFFVHHRRGPQHGAQVHEVRCRARAPKGFIVTTPGVSTGARLHGPPDAFIFDTDGDLVWWTFQSLSGASEGISRAHLSWDAKAVWVMTTCTGKILCVSMDGTDGDRLQQRPHEGRITTSRCCLTAGSPR